MSGGTVDISASENISKAGAQKDHEKYRYAMYEMKPSNIRGFENSNLTSKILYILSIEGVNNFSDFVQIL